ncbi:short-chain dehydrogenase/reductase, partial [Streptomyces sp. NPDC001250]
MTSPDSPDSPVWFITGCSSGLGRALAGAVLERGWRAVVTARDAGKAVDVVAGHEE